jgi:hypothetical protein
MNIGILMATARVSAGGRRQCIYFFFGGAIETNVTVIECFMFSCKWLMKGIYIDTINIVFIASTQHIERGVTTLLAKLHGAEFGLELSMRQGSMLLFKEIELFFFHYFYCKNKITIILWDLYALAQSILLSD